MKMRLLKKSPPLALLLVIALLALLPSLAVLQYYLLDQVSEGGRERMRSSLQVIAAQFCQEFDREVKNAYLHFQTSVHHFGRLPDAAPADAESEQEFAARYRRWLDTSSHPRLVGEIYQTQNRAQNNASGIYQLTRFNPATGLFEPCDWPDKLKDMREKLISERTARGSARMLFQGLFRSTKDKPDERAGTFIRISLGPIDSDIPGLIIPIISSPRLPGPGRFSLPIPEKYRIVALDLDYIKGELLPALAKKYFFPDGKGEYNVAVVSRADPQKIIYQSEKNITGASDFSSNLFSIQITDADRMFIARMPQPGNAKRGSKGREGENENRHLAVSVIRKNIDISGIDKDRGEKGSGPGDLMKSVFQLNNEGHWQMAVRHRSGSLEAAVAGARRWHLAISFGILLLLGVTVGLIALSSRRAQKLAAQQMEFVAGVSHELRTPLAVICSAAENLADGVIDNSAQIKRYGGLIRDEGRRLAGMVEQVLEFAGAHAQRRAYELRPVELDRVIEAALAACRMQLAEGGFEVERKIAAMLPQVNADAAALSRALQNLLSNAMKYSGVNRWLGLSAESVQTPQGQEVQIKVSDRGMGIAPSELPHIFEPFYRGREVVAAQIHGSGLGLSLVNHIIAAHGGRVSVESKMKQGTTFTLHLPVAAARELSTGAAKESYEQTYFAR
jgi:signal transduction histidine kinase